MKCRKCNSPDTRVTVTEHKEGETWRYCRCLDCGNKFKTIEVYAQRKRGPKPGAKLTGGKHRRGEQNHASVLLESNVRDIRRLAQAGTKQRLIAIQFGISESVVSRIVRRQMWDHVA